MRKSNVIIKTVLAIFAVCLLGIQQAMAADTWDYPWHSMPDGKFGGGNGTQESPYLISTAQQLSDLARKVNKGTSYAGKYFKLTRDIVLNDIDWTDYETTREPKNLSSLKEWVSIGDLAFFSSNYFEGIFDGDNHSISGLYLMYNGKDKNTDTSIGLFGKMRNAIVRNLTIKDSYLRYDHDNFGAICSMGFLAGYLKTSQISNCHVDNSHIYVLNEYETARFGGFVGWGSGEKSLTDCSFTNGSIYVRTDERYLTVGGFMGLGSPTLVNCRIECNATIEADHNYSTLETGVYGFCEEAENVIGCVSKMNFNVRLSGNKTKFTDSESHLYCFGLCKTVNHNISRSAYMGTLTLASSKLIDKTNTFAPVGSVGGKATDCAFYCKVIGKESISSVEKGKFTFYPFGMAKGSIKSAERVALLYDDKYFISSNPLWLSREQPMVQGGTVYAATMDELKGTNIYDALSNPYTAAPVWGRVSDGGDFDGCPLPVACGGKVNTELRGEGTEQSPYLIGSEDELRYVTDRINSGSITTQGKYFALDADFDLSGSEPIAAIGNSEAHPFLGTFDGQKHIIVGANLKEASLFGYVGGTVRRLAMLGATVNTGEDHCGAPMVHQLGVTIDGNDLGGTIEKCYTGGDICIKVPDDKENPLAGGLCGIAKNGSQITNCYFKGRITVEMPSGERTPSIGGLLAKSSSVECCKVYSSYASFDTYPKRNAEIHGICGSGEAMLERCCSVCDRSGTDEDRDTKDGTNYAYDAAIFSSVCDYDVWSTASGRPVLKDAYSYVGTASDGSDTEVYLDAIPVRDSRKPVNDIFHVDGTGHEGDKLLWALPNVAVYSAADKTDYILNCWLEPKKPFNYSLRQSTPAEEVKVNMHYPLAVTEGQQYYPLCLPGTVYKSNLPEGSRLFVGGQLRTDGTETYPTYVNVADVDSVEGGMPFIAWLPYSDTKGGGTIDLLMRSRMAVEPATEIVDYEGNTQKLALTGTFKGNTDYSYNVCNTVKTDKKDNIYLERPSYVQQVAPFTAYASSKTDVELRDYLFISETGDNTDELLKEYDQHKLPLLIQRKWRVDTWNTMCLPFDMTEDEIDWRFGPWTKIEEFSGAEVTADGVCTLKFEKKGYDGLKAGHCYLVAPGNSSTKLGIFTLPERIISNELHDSECSLSIDGTLTDIKFCGTFARKVLGDSYNEESQDESDDEEYFIQDNKIYHVANGQNVLLNGFRAYITAGKAAAAALSKARILHSDGSTTDLRLVEVGSTADGKQRVYDLQGIEQNANSQQHGVRIKGGRKYVK